MILFREATDNDANLLANLAFNSEEHRDYIVDYINNFHVLYIKTAISYATEIIDSHLVYIMEMENEVIGFWGLRKSADSWELELFYITPKHIGKGYGKMLWNHLITECKRQDITYFQMITSPQSVKFYEKMGAKVITHVESPAGKESMIPKLEYIVFI